MASFIEKIRQSDNATKKRYVIIFSVIAGTFAFSIWIISVRGILARAAVESATGQKTEISTIDSIKSVWNGISTRTKKTIIYFKDKAGETNEVVGGTTE
jgi:hypothetical protein